MMKRASKPNAMLIELVIVLLFFSLSAAVILQLFVASHNKSMRNAVDSAALMTAEDIAERFYTSELEKEAFFALEGWSAGADGLEGSIDINGRALRYVVTGETQQEAAGSLDELTMTVYDGELTVLILPVARYLPGEGTP